MHRRFRIACALIVSLMTVAPLAGAQTTRAEGVRQQRIARAATIAAPGRTGLESGIYRFEQGRYLERFEQGFGGFHPKLGGLSTGSGFAYGVEFRNDALAAENLLLRAAAQISTNGYQRYETQVALPRLANGRVLLDLTARYRNYAQEDFFGGGPDSSEANRANYRLEDADVAGTVALHAREWLTTGFRGGILRTNTSTGTDEDLPSVETLFSPVDAPAVDVQPHYLYGGPFVEFDYRDSGTHPRDGGYYRFEWTAFSDRGASMFSFNRFDGEVRQYFPFFNQRRVIAFRAKTSMVDADTGHRVPFFLRPTLGGSEDLRGFREFRFQDENLMLMNLEYRWEAFSGLDMAIFGDAGKVFRSRSEFDFTDLETSWGIGARFNSVNGVFWRIDTAFSHEGTRIFYKFGHFF